MNREKEHHAWTGGKYIAPNGYVKVSDSERVEKGISAFRVVSEHVVIVERLIGPLRRGVEIHHVNGLKSDNRNRNLVVCEDRVYHYLIERRTKALRECGNPNWRVCCFCRKWDDPANLSIRGPNGHIYHLRCRRLNRNPPRQVVHTEKGTPSQVINAWERLSREDERPS